MIACELMVRHHQLEFLIGSECEQKFLIASTRR